MVAIIIGLISIFIAVTLGVAGLIADMKHNMKAADFCQQMTLIGLFVSLACMVCFLLYYTITLKPSAKEYPASEYEVKCKIVDYDGKSDTTYILIPVESKEQIENGKKAIEEEEMGISTNRNAK